MPEEVWISGRYTTLHVAKLSERAAPRLAALHTEAMCSARPRRSP